MALSGTARAGSYWSGYTTRATFRRTLLSFIRSKSRIPEHLPFGKAALRARYCASAAGVDEGMRPGLLKRPGIFSASG